MTKISYFGKQNSTLGSVVPLAMFFLLAVLFSIIRYLSITLYLGTNGKLWDKSRLGGLTTLLSLLGPKICPA